MTEAILFPGQGAQYVGMGKDWSASFPVARETFREASDALGLDLAQLCWERGDDVHRTDVAQPGILTCSVAIIRVLQAEQGLDLSQAPLCAGLSLGEYTALWAAGALEFADAVRLVRLRGEAMQAASEATPSSMTSLIGANLEQAEALAAIGAEVGICAVANRNAPGQIVLSGELAALDAVEAAAAAQGVKRALRLTVAEGFHSECMRPARERLQAALGEVNIDAPRVPVVTNVTARPVKGPGEIREFLAQQVCAPVLWEDSMRWALGEGVTNFLEPGPGTVLAGLFRRIGKAAGVTPTVRAAAVPSDL